jgi:hypothetical protein
MPLGSGRSQRPSAAPRYSIANPHRCSGPESRRPAADGGQTIMRHRRARRGAARFPAMHWYAWHFQPRSRRSRSPWCLRRLDISGPHSKIVLEFRNGSGMPLGIGRSQRPSAAPRYSIANPHRCSGPESRRPAADGGQTIMRHRRARRGAARFPAMHWYAWHFQPRSRRSRSPWCLRRLDICEDRRRSPDP